MAENPGFYPVQASSIRIGGYILIKNRPCKVINMSTSKTGKHGHAKINFTATDIFTDKKMEEIFYLSEKTKSKDAMEAFRLLKEEKYDRKRDKHVFDLSRGRYGWDRRDFFLVLMFFFILQVI